MDLVELKNTRNLFEEFRKVYEEEGFSTLIFGAGAGADWAIRLLNQHQIDILGIIDNNILLQGKTKEGLEIMSMEKAKVMYHIMNIKILVATPRHEKEVTLELAQVFDKEDIWSFECELYASWISDIGEYKQYIEDNFEKFELMYKNLEDDLSRETLKNVIQGRLTGELKYFNRVCQEDQYFDLYQMSTEETFVDVGAFTGDSLEKFLELTKGNYKKVICLEPDPDCVERLNHKIAKLGITDIRIIEKGAWNENGKISFRSDSSHGASNITGEEGFETIETAKLDDVINEEVTFIKMDIEGAEMKALEGAKELIRTFRPTLAICVYHRVEDMLEIYEYIKNLVPQYRIFMRHYNVSGTETVLYAMI